MKSGIIVINKPKGITSHKVVEKLRTILKTKKVGHAGTLDPFATGVLVIGVNKGTKVLEFFLNDKKRYYVKAKLGIITETFDLDGEIKEQNEVTKEQIESVKDVVFSFVGEYLQVPPAYSAKKYKGKHLYEYAREGKIINLPPKLVKIYDISNFKQIDTDFSFEVEVSPGTYIRSLIMDIGYKVGCGAVTIELCRKKSGIFSLEHSINLEDASYNKIIPIDNCINFPYVVVNHGDKVLKGHQIYKSNILEYSEFEKGEYVKIYNEQKEFIGIGITERSSKFLATLLKMPERDDRIVKIYKNIYEVT